MAIKLTSPHKYRERMLLFGGGGVGKTNTVLNIISHMHEGRMMVVDSDYSEAYERALATDFPDLDDRVDVYSCAPTWDEFLESVQEAVANGDPETDWLVIDPVSGSWDWVQEWTLEASYGRDMTSMLIELRKQHGHDSSGYAKAVSELMNWGLVKKEYGKLWREVQRWKGHLILTAEAKEVGNRDDSDTRMLYGPLGFKPAGESRLRHVTSTTLFLDHPKRGSWRMTTVKDRNREEMDKVYIEDFGIDYLQDVAGWDLVRAKRAKKAQGPGRDDEEGAA